MKFKIENRTMFPTSQLRSFVTRAYRVVSDAAGPKRVAEYERKWHRINITFARSNRRGKGRCTGHAYYYSNRAHVGVHDAAIKADLGIVLVHEMGHLLGLRHGDMRGSALWMHDWKNNCEKSYAIHAWANDLALCPKPTKPKATTNDRRAKDLARTLAGITRWQSKAKRAANALRKLNAKRKRLEKLITTGDTL